MRPIPRDQSPLLDTSMLDELRALDAGSPSFLRDLVEEFLASCESELAAIDQSLVSRDLDGVWRLAHGLKGACFMVGAKRLGDAVTELERASRANDPAMAASQLSAIRRAQGATREALLAMLQAARP